MNVQGLVPLNFVKDITAGTGWHYSIRKLTVDYIIYDALLDK
jgi:hypothetical protein